MTADRPSDPPSTPPAEGPLREQLRNLTRRQQRFERYLSRKMRVDLAGLAVMDRLVSAGPATPSQLARELSTSTAAMTLVVDRLADGGHVTRQPHPSDRRKVLVTPAEEWEGAAYEHVGPLVDGIGEITEAMTDQERATVAAFLRRAVAAYDRATEG
ncbi:MarR family transcriptional regulator [Streptomyces sp. NPDC001941]|uniref:MarR family winged helix-turn-helix transcriptional regulator n=1 Tax=Streptomyces sp. NPDC001941 TaxID=3154659 RepID=UPI0033277DF0